MPKLRISLGNIDDETLYESKHIALKDVEIRTPSKSLDLSKFIGPLKPPETIRGINEVYRRLSPDAVRSIMSNPSDRSFDSKINSQLNKAKDAEINLFFFEYLSPQLPAGQELEFICDTIHSYSDVVTIPKIYHMEQQIAQQPGYFDAYKKFVNDFIAEIETLNNKSIMGMFPPITWIQFKELANFYLDKGITTFCIDFNGRTPTTIEKRNIRPFLKEIKNRGLEEEHLVYGLNANAGKIAKETGVVPAKDIISFGFGVDILGLKHLALKGPQEMYERMKEAKKGKKVMRVFDREDYVYKDIDLLTEEAKEFIGRAGFDFSMLQKAPSHVLDNIRHVINMDEHGLESKNIVSMLDNQEPLFEYLNTKSGVAKKDLESMRKSKEAMG